MANPSVGKKDCAISSSASVTIVGLGPGSVEHLTRRAWRALQEADTLYLRTNCHPAVAELPSPGQRISFDDMYEAYSRFDDVYAQITARLLDAARRGEAVVYAVPGDPLVGEATVARLLTLAAQENLQVEIIHGISFIEPCLALLEIDALDGLQVLDALEVAEAYHPPINPALPALLAQVYSRGVASNLKLTLMNQYPDTFPVKLLHAAGTDEALVETLPLYQIDRSPHIGVMTALYLPSLDELSSFPSFQNIIAHLRSPAGCPWDREQTHQSLRPFLIEEAYEVLETLDADDPAALCEEMGDLLLQIVLHTQIATDEGEFQMADVLRQLNQKMIRRHPHVYADADVASDSDKVTRNWEDIKRREKAARNEPSRSILDGIPKMAPALLVAHRYSARVAKIGFDWEDAQGVIEKAREEWDEIFSAESDETRALEIGDLIFVLVNWLRWLGVDDPESLMRSINDKFYKRFSYVEAQALARGMSLSDMSLDQLDAWWREAKQLEN
ncbi:MAG: nucleoside triphosphate pyrophosphohydrolase [Chloroflexi bacterium]|nr:nucleoside triphosphate pyrophosphohydrolase [Chloroflexota bacterium]